MGVIKFYDWRFVTHARDTQVGEVSETDDPLQTSNLLLPLGHIGSYL